MPTKTFAGKFLSHLEKIDRQQIEAYLLKLIQERNFLEVIFNRMLEGIMVTDASLRILFMNTAARKALGLKGPEERLAGRHLPDLITSPRLRERIANFDPSLSEVTSEEIKIHKPRGRTLRIGFLPVGNEDGSITSIVFLISDITEQKKAEEARRQKQNITALATLTAGVAHEIKNPLNSLQIHAQLLKKYINLQPDAVTSECRERSLKSADIILEEISRLSKIVDQFLLAVRPTRLSLRPGDVDNVIRQVVEIMKPTLQEKGIKLDINPEPAQTEVRLNEQRLAQAFLNIIKNAQESLDGSNEPRIRIVSRIEGKNIAIDFIDNGCGIPEENLAKIFEPYFSTKFHGSGLGLVLVYRIVSQHAGNISVKSTVDEGTTFTVTLPLSRHPVRLLPRGVSEK